MIALDRNVVPSGAELGVPLLSSAVIPSRFRHGFTTRAGGVSGPPFESLNLGMKEGEARTNVVENRRRLLLTSGAAVMHFARQEHGTKVLALHAGDESENSKLRPADILCTDAAGVAVAVYVADCVPVLLADTRRGVVAAVHAGWRGTAAGVLGAALAALRTSYCARPHDVRVALGPAIGRCCFEVGEEVVESFRALFPTSSGVIIDCPGHRQHVDLRRALRLQLEAAGVPGGAIDASAACTLCNPARRFYSYRRDQGRNGLHMAFICPPAPGAPRLFQRARRVVSRQQQTGAATVGA